MRSTIKSVCLVLGILLAAGCTPRAQGGSSSNVQILGESEALPAGVVANVWEEPMVDVIDVPPGLDPDGAYYRPGHKAVVEIRQGRWQYQEGQ